MLEVDGWAKRFMDSERDFLTSDDRPPLNRGATKRLRTRVLAAYGATPSYEKTYPEAQRS